MNFKILTATATLLCLSLFSKVHAYGIDDYKNDYQTLFPVIVENDQKCFRGDLESCKVSSSILNQLNRSLTGLRDASPSDISVQLLSTSLSGYIGSRHEKLANGASDD